MPFINSVIILPQRTNRYYELQNNIYEIQKTQILAE